MGRRSEERKDADGLNRTKCDADNCPKEVDVRGDKLKALINPKSPCVVLGTVVQENCDYGVIQLENDFTDLVKWKTKLKINWKKKKPMCSQK